MFVIPLSYISYLEVTELAVPGSLLSIQYFYALYIVTFYSLINSVSLWGV